MTLEDAIAYVTRTAQTESFPCVASEVVEEIVGRNIRATVWAPSTAYSFGAKVQPTVPNGHFYNVTQPGTSGATEPEWNTRQISRTYDGDTLIWRECETDFDGNLYNLRNAIHEIWSLKAAMAANNFDVKLDTETYNRSQIYEHCKQMAASFAPVEF